jgi:S-adenosylmethionine synthetase
MEQQIIVTEGLGLRVEQRPVEFVERKGIGHPDSLCDGIAERISVEYSRWCQEQLGVQLHHNFDKVQLVAGAVDVTFGGGQMLKPIYIQIAGRGTSVGPDGRRIPVSMIAIEAAKAYLRQTMRYLNPDQQCVVNCYSGSGASELVHVVERVTANDTSFGVAHWPLSNLERTVYDTTEYLNEIFINHFPIGEDVKVMGARLENQVSLTCAVPFLARQIYSLRQYREAKAEVRQAIQAFAAAQTTLPVQVELNVADDEAAGSVYLTLTGTSGECGDDGAVGRGNRITGLITPFRASSMEAAAGKNPISHAGKLYNVLALLAAQSIVAQVAAVRGVEVALLSQIGRPLEDPLVASATIWTGENGLTAGVAAEVKRILSEHLADIGRVRTMLANQEIALF